MSDFSPYYIALGAADYPTKYSSMLAYLEASIDALEASAIGGSLPGQTGNAGKFITTDGTTAFWSNTATLPVFNGSGASIVTVDGAINTGRGAEIALLGFGGAEPNKYLRALAGAFEIVNDDYTTPLLSLTDAGAMTIAGSISAGSSITSGSTITAASGGMVASGVPGAAPTGVSIGGDGTSAQVRMIDPSRSANNRRAYLATIGGAITLGFHNDAIDAATTGLRITGGQASGISETQLYGVVTVVNGAARVQGATATNRALYFQTGSTDRLFVGADGNTESGGDAGSNFVVATFSDAGAFKAFPLTVNRATGLTTLAGLSVTGGATVGTTLAVSGVTTLSSNLGVSGSITGSGGTSLSAGSGASALTLNGTANAVGAQISFFGNGAVTPNKYVRALDGKLEFVNSAYNAVLASLTDAGVMTANGFVGPLTGAASLNVLKSGDTMTGALFANSGVMVTGSAGSPTLGGLTMSGGTTFAQQLWLDPSRTANNKRMYTAWSAGSFQIGFHDDAISSAVAGLTIVGGHASGVTSTTLYGAVTAAGGITASLTGAASLNVLKSGDTMSGTLNAPQVGVQGAAGTDRGYFLRTGSVNRWGIIAQSGAESGGNAGSDFWIYRLTDAGSYIDAPLVINRATGGVSLSNALNVTGAATVGGALAASTSVTTPRTITTDPDGLRMKPNSGSTSYGVIFRNDGANFYIMKTALNDSNGSWTTHRPFVMDVTNGNVNVGGTGGTSHTLGNTGANLALNGANIYLTSSGTVEEYAATHLMYTSGGPTVMTGRTGVYSTTVGQLEVKDQTGSGAAMMSFHRPSAYGLMLGLDTDQAFKLGSFSFGAGVSRFISDASGSFLVHYRMLVGGGEISFGDNSGSGTGATRRMSMGSDATYMFYVNKFDASGNYQTSPFLIRRSDDAYLMSGGPIVNNNLHLQGDASNAYIRATTGAFFFGSNNQHQWQINTGGQLVSTLSSASIELGALGSANTPFIDFHSSTTSNDYDVRLIASGGSTSPGFGLLTIQANGGVSVAGSLSVDATTINNTIATLTNTGSNGIQIGLRGNGAITPNKTVRVVNGVFDIVNSAYSASILGLTDAGVLTLGTGYNGYVLAPQGSVEFGIGSTVPRTTIGADATNSFFVNRKDSGGTYLATDFKINRATGAAEFSYAFTSPGTIAVYNAAQIRLKQANSTAGVSTLLHSDGGAFYFLLTNSGDADGTFNALRPFKITASTGAVSMEHGLSVTTGITSTSTNSTSNLHLVDTGTSGANLKLTGNGGTTPAKFIRANGGKLEFINNGYSAVIADLTDAGLFTAGGGLQSAGGALITGANLAPSSTGNGGTSLSGTSTGSQMLMSDPSRSANNRRLYMNWAGGVYSIGFHDDAITTGTAAMTISGGYASGPILANFNCALRTSFRFDSYGAPSNAHHFSSCPDTSAGSKVTIANGGTYDIATGSGMLVIYDDAGTYGFSVLMTAYGTVYAILNPSSMNLNSVTSPKINVFYNAGTGKYRIQNTTGSSVTLYVTSFQFRNGS